MNESNFYSIESNLNRLLGMYQTHFNEVKEIKREIENLSTKINKLDSSDSKKLSNHIKHLQTSLSQLSNDINALKLTSKQEQSAIKVSSLLHGQDFFNLLDEGRFLVSDANRLLEELEIDLSDIEMEEAEGNEGGIGKNEVESIKKEIETLLNSDSAEPDLFEELAGRCKDLISNHPQEALVLKQYAHRCYTKAAQLYLENERTSLGFDMLRQCAEIGQIDETHPLYDLESVLDQIAQNSNLSLSRHGVKISGLDSGDVKRGSISFRKRSVDGQEKIQANFRVSTHTRNNLETTLAMIERDLNGFIDSLPEDLKANVQIFRGIPDGYQGEVNGDFKQDLSKGLVIGQDAIEIRFPGIGKVKIGARNEPLALFNRVVVETDANQPPGEAINQIQSMLSALGIGYALSEEIPEEFERKKIAFLFHTFFPREAYQMEHRQYFYECSLDTLKESIIETVPLMREIFLKYLENPDLLRMEEVAPGYSVLTISDLADQMREVGAVGVMSGYSGEISNLVKVILGGALSSRERFESGLSKAIGASSIQDHETGGANYVFTRVLTKKMMDAKQKKVNYDNPEAPPVMESACQVDRFPFSGEIQLLYDLSVVNQGGHAYKRDKYGSKREKDYAGRSNLIEFCENLDKNSVSNELMLFERIPPEKLKKILVRSEFAKESLIEELTQAGLVEEREGKKYLKGYDSQDLDEFIITGKAFAPEMWL